jgi:hypothetical protein
VSKSRPRDPELELDSATPPAHRPLQPTAEEYRVLTERLERIRMLAGDVETPERAAERRREVIATLKREREHGAPVASHSRFPS